MQRIKLRFQGKNIVAWVGFRGTCWQISLDKSRIQGPMQRIKLRVHGQNTVMGRIQGLMQADE